MGMPYWDEAKYNEPDEIDGPEDITLPSTMHHMQAKAELDCLMTAGAITDAEAQKALQLWRARKELATEDMIEASIQVLAENDLVSEDEADGLRDKASA